ncbi:MAG: OmpH family outer membrane protein [Trueperaceae bacterium]|nr:OmpH family outer membrane protein [Trueperaceae bacterium]
MNRTHARTRPLSVVSLVRGALLAVALAFAAGAAAQEAGATVAFVDTQALISAHPAQSQIDQLSGDLDAELQDLLAQRAELVDKQAAEGLTAEEQELLQALSVTIQTRRDEGLAAIRDAAGPAEEAANAIIRDIAEERGYALVLDVGAAAGLVVYAGDGVPEFTDDAVALMTERFPAE